MTTTPKPYSGPCTPNNKTCPGMTYALRGGGERPIGIRVSPMVDFKTGQASAATVYQFPKKVDGCSYIVLNYCPFCGAALRKLAKKTGRRSTRTARATT